jgi:hypothetical protein
MDICKNQNLVAIGNFDTTISLWKNCIYLTKLHAHNNKITKVKFIYDFKFVNTNEKKEEKLNFLVSTSLDCYFKI